MFAAFFGFMAVLWAVDIDFIAPDKSLVGLSSINGFIAKHFPFSNAFYIISEIIGYLALATVGFFGLLGLWQLIKRKSIFKVDSRIYLLAFLYIALAIVYVVFEKIYFNVRPVIMHGETVPEASFPSSHTILAFGVFGSAAVVIGDYIKNATAAKAAGIAFNVLAILAVITRFLSGVHWLSDIAAGILLGCALLCLFIAFIDCDIIKRRNKDENVG